MVAPTGGRRRSVRSCRSLLNPVRKVLFKATNAALPGAFEEVDLSLERFRFRDLERAELHGQVHTFPGVVSLGTEKIAPGNAGHP